MDNETLLQELTTRLASGALSRETVLGRVMGESKKPSYFSITKLLYALGGIVAVLGVIFFVQQIWDELGSVGRMSITLIFGLILAGIGSMLIKTKRESRVGEIFHAIAGLLIPGGALVALNESGYDFDSLWPVTLVFGIIALFYFLLNVYHKALVLTFFTIANITAFVFLLVEALIPGYSYQHENLYTYLTMAVGISYLLLAKAFSASWNKSLTPVLNFFGSAGFFVAAFTKVDHSAPWQILFFILAVLGLGLAVKIKSRGILLVSTVAFIGHFVFITNEYFANSVSWPILLVVLGFFIIGMGYLSLSLNKKYIN